MAPHPDSRSGTLDGGLKGMCGIAGKVSLSGREVDPLLLERMTETMIHRGPDELGLHCEAGVGLAMRRLSIIDVADGHQPVRNENQDVIAVFNGEIYNFRELQDMLRSKGHRFNSQSDSEVIPHLYEEYGEDFCKHLRGMFAIAIWDARRRKLILARDRVGKKPLFFAFDEAAETVWFGSTLASITCDPEVDTRISAQSVANFLACGYVPNPSSIYVGVEKLRPGHTITIAAGEARQHRYWQLAYDPQPITDEEARERLLEHLREAVRIRMVSEVPLGAFLSGGLDSSAVVALMAEAQASPVKTFSIGFGEESFNELPFARAVAEQFGTDHHELVVTPDALELLPKLARHYGEPFGDSSAIPSMLLAEMASRSVTVAMNGDGGDESFAGYERYPSSMWISRKARLTGMVPASLRMRAAELVLRLLPDWEGALRINRRLSMADSDLRVRYGSAMTVAFDEFSRRTLFQPEFAESLGELDLESAPLRGWDSGGSPASLNNLLAADVNGYLADDLLVKMDVASMASSVEARSPFLDHRVMEFAATLPEHMKLRNGMGKAILKDAMKGILPEEIIHRDKRGFSVPIKDWFSKQMSSLPGELLLGEGAFVHQFIKPEAISRLIEADRTNTRGNAEKLWMLIQLEVWYQEVGRKVGASLG